MGVLDKNDMGKIKPIVTPNGSKVDKEGRPVNEKGYLLDDKGNILD